MKFKLKTFSKYSLIDMRDFYKQVYKHLLKTKQQFVFTKIGIIDRETCKKYI